MKRIPILLSFFLPLAAWAAPAQQIHMEAALANPMLEAGKRSNTYVKVGLTGFELADQADRPPVNVSLVIDKSGSMEGEKIVQARNAAIMAIERLQPDDIVSVVTYDSNVNVLVPATKVTDREALVRRIQQLEANGSTALFGGVSQGAGELRKFLDRQKVNRVILLSDGQANVGPSSAGELGELGESLIKEGISVTTIGLGLGYNEDLMAKLAIKSDGNHVFVEKEEELVAVFNAEFGDILSVVAQEVEIAIRCAEGVKPIRVLGREADISGRVVKTSLNQIYSTQEKFVVLEVEIPGGAADATQAVAEVSVSYANMLTHAVDKLAAKVEVAFTGQPEMVTAKVNEKVMVSCVMLIATEANAAAVQLRDEGKVEEAKSLLKSNSEYLLWNSGALKSQELNDYAVQNMGAMESLDKADWNRSRKALISRNKDNITQQKAFPATQQQGEIQLAPGALPRAIMQEGAVVPNAPASQSNDAIQQRQQILTPSPNPPAYPKN